MEENITENQEVASQNNVKIGSSQSQVAGAIIIAGLIIAGAILLRGNSAPVVGTNGNPNNGGAAVVAPAKVTAQDNTLGNTNAKVTLIMYEDFQCPFCDKFFQESEKTIISTYVSTGDVRLVYRDFAFLGTESGRASEAARCAGDQGKFWDFHDYLFSHQKGENQGAFADANLKIFAKTLGLNQTSFDQCLDASKYAKAVVDSTNEGRQAGVSGTPKGFIMRGGKVVSTINGALPYASVKEMIDTALK